MQRAALRMSRGTRIVSLQAPEEQMPVLQVHEVPEHGDEGEAVQEERGVGKGMKEEERVETI